MTYWRATRLKRSRREREKHVVFNLKQNTANIAVRVSGHYLTFTISIVQKPTELAYMILMCRHINSKRIDLVVKGNGQTEIKSVVTECNRYQQ